MKKWTYLPAIAAGLMIAGLFGGCEADGDAEADTATTDQLMTDDAAMASDDAAMAAEEARLAEEARMAAEAERERAEAAAAAEAERVAAEARAAAEDMAAMKEDKTVKVLMETSYGAITLELDGEAAPVSVENFLSYVDDGTYNGTIFHRVINGFMIQGGGFEPDMNRRPSKAPIANEWQNGLTNERGTIAMARTGDPDSATNQFFINVSDNGRLSQAISGGAGYAVFGKVVNGMDVVDAIKETPTGMRNGMGDVPVEPIVITSVTRVE